MKSGRENKILTRAFLIAITFFLFFSATTICEDFYVSNFYNHQNCLSSEHCLFSATSDSDKNSSKRPALPISHCNTGSSCFHNLNEIEGLKLLIEPDISTSTVSFNHLFPESNLIKSIFNPPRTLI